MQKFDNVDDAFRHAPMASFVYKLKVLGMIGYIGLVFYYPILFTFLNISQTSSYIPLVLFWLPMLFAIRGLLIGNPYTFAWSNFVIMWCFIHGLTAIWTYNGNKLFIVLELIFLTMAFIGNTYFARYRGRELGLALPKIKDVKQQEKELFEKK